MRHLELYRQPRSAFAPGSLWNMLSDFDDVFGRAVRDTARDTDVSSDRVTFSPRVDIEETKEAYVLKFDLPGVKKEDLKIDVLGKTLTLTGERKEERESEHNGFKKFECVRGQFTRSFTLPEGVDADRVEAQLAEGVLRVALPKQEVEKPRTINVK